MRIVVTGAGGFLGWHLRCALRARNSDVVIAVGSELDTDQMALDTALAGADAVIHLAGVNRAQPDELREMNLRLASHLTQALDRVGLRPHVVYANSVQAGNGSPYGDGKQAAADHLNRWAVSSGATVTDMRLPNLFGEHGRPSYNSFVATFCHELAHGGRPTIVQDREVPLLHAQDAADVLIGSLAHGKSSKLEPPGRALTVSKVLAKLEGFRDEYALGQIPDIFDPIDLALFNTYRSYCFPDHYPLRPAVHTDQRGDLFEVVSSRGGQAHVFCSSTRPGFTRGEHFHRRKVERFLVLRGTAEIRLRRLFSDEVHVFPVTGDNPAAIDMPTMWAHSITNTGQDELVTLFWAHEILDPDHTDTYLETVRPLEVTA